MGTINLLNSKGRDAVVNTESVSVPLKVRWVDAKGRQAQSARILRGTLDRDADALTKEAGALDKVADLLVNGDPEVDLETYGSYIRDTQRVYIGPDRKVVHKVQQWEILRNPDGTEKERRPRQIAEGNVATETPLKWSGKLMKKSEVFSKFVFVAKQQVVHVNGLTYDYLYGMAKELEEKESLMLLGAGPKSNLPLVFTRGGTPYRGFLEGRTQGDKYCLILHLSNMELKAAEQSVADLTEKVEEKAAKNKEKEEKDREKAAKDAVKERERLAKEAAQADKQEALEKKQAAIAAKKAATEAAKAAKADKPAKVAKAAKPAAEKKPATAPKTATATKGKKK
jgi:hypothetical protein